MIAAMAVIVLVILCFKLCSAFVLDGDNVFTDDEQQATLRLPTEYHFKGDVTSTTFGIIRPFEIWYSELHNRSREDTYGSMVRRYYYGDGHRTYTIHSTTTNELVSKTVCTVEKNDDKPKNFLPPYSSDKFRYSGQTTYDNKLVDVWKYSAVLKHEHQSATQLLVVKGEEYDVPVVWEETVVSAQSGSVVSRSITRYYDFRQPNLDDVTYTQAEKYCVPEEDDGPRYAHADLPLEVSEAFQRYKNQHNKKYDSDEEKLRALIFERNWRLVTEHNSRNVSYKLGLNKFSDRLPAELAPLSATRPGELYKRSHPSPFSEHQLKELTFRLPRNYDMRIDGTISAVKDQGDCGSCYAFATVATVEGALARKNVSWNVDLSEQSLVDCSWSKKNHGCSGGYLDAALEHIKRNGIPTEMEYGIYLAEEGVCKYNSASITKVTRIKSFSSVVGGTLAMKAVLHNYGPVASSINAMEDLKYYESGIYYNPDCNKNATNHAVTVVGYGESDGRPYWIIKNSWGEDWGEAGYMLLSSESNNCRILDDAYFVTI